MLRQKALVEYLGQVNTGGIEGALLFNKDGMLLAYSGNAEAKTNANVFSALVASVWEAFEKKAGRDELKESLIVCEDGILGCTRVASMLLAVKARKDMPLGMVRTKLQALAKYLDAPLTSVSHNMV